MKAQTNSKQVPSLDEEIALLSQGYSFIAGVDEAGRGCLAGPVVAAAVILPLGEQSPLQFSPDECLERFAGVRDSKQVTAKERERLYDVVMQHALAVSVGIGSVELIDERNILQATKCAMRDAITQLSTPPQALLLDAIRLPDIDLLQRSIIKGDALCLSIAAASIIAKVTRDRMMVQLHELFPNYGFAQHKGYGTEEHLTALQKHGATPHHRRSFAPVRELYGLFQEEELNSSRMATKSKKSE